MFPSDLEVLTEVDFDPMRDHVLLVGSVADGWGNATSDIDVIVVSPDASHRRSISNYSVNLERWLDVRRMSVSSIVALRESVELNASLPDQWGAHRVASLDLLDAYHRVARGRVLAAPLATREKVELCTDKLIRESSLTHLVIARARWEDAAGASLSGDHDQVAYAAEIGLWHVVDALAALTGVTNPGSKWRLKKLAAISQKGGWIKRLARRLTDERRAWSNSVDLLGWLGSGIEFLTAKMRNIDVREPSEIHSRPDRLEYDGGGLKRIAAGTGMEYLMLRRE
jgi:predicted nucleotidyltransferase